MNSAPENTNSGNPIPPAGASAPQSRGAQEGPRHLRPADVSTEEPFDLLGCLSLGLGLLSLLMTPVAMTPIAFSLVAFAVVSILCGTIRLIDERFHRRGDAAIAGMISSLVVLTAVAIIPTIEAASDFAEELDIPFFGCTSINQDDGIEYDSDFLLHDRYGEDCDREEDWDDSEIDEEPEYDDYSDGDEPDDHIIKNTEKIGRGIDKFIKSEEDNINPSESEDDASDEDDEGATSEKGRSESSDEATIKKVPLADKDDTQMKQVPLSDDAADTMRQA